MNLDVELETADDALVIVSQQNLLADKSPLAALPMSVEVLLLREVCGQAKAIAEVPFFHLARVLPEFLSTIRALHGDFVSTTRRGSEPLPLSIALIAAASFLIVAGPSLEGSSTNRATPSLFAASVIPVVSAAMLMEVDVPLLLAWLLVAWNYLTTTACAIDNVRAIIFNPFRHGEPLSMDIIPC